MQKKLWSVLTLAVFAGFCCHGALSCPKQCTCYFGNVTTEVVCYDAAMERFPGDGLPDNTTSLTIQYTNLSSLVGHELQATPLLLELHLTGNKLSTLPAVMLKNLAQLHTLDLSGNKLQQLPAGVFHHAPLRTLVLRDNVLSSAEPDWLPRHSALSWLDLAGNRLRKFPFALLQSLGELLTLHLSANLLEVLPPGALRPLARLQRLHLEENKLRSLEPHTFRTNANLTHLFLQDNWLETLPPEVFHGLAQLEHLDLERNRLRMLAPGTLEVGAGWVGLELNPWHCDGGISYLWEMLRTRPEQTAQPGPQCSSPAHLRHRYISTLTHTEMNQTHSHTQGQA